MWKITCYLIDNRNFLFRIGKMNYQSRSSRIKSMPRNDDSIYCSAIDSFSNSNVTDMTRSSSRQSISAHSRNYIDPWDLENYDYIRYAHDV